MDHFDIKRYVETLMVSKMGETGNVLSGKRFAYENVQFTPKNGETFIRGYIRPASTLSETLSGDHKSLIGLYQFSIITPSNTATSISDAIVNYISSLFKIYSIHQTDSGSFQITSHLQVLPSVEDAASFMTPVRIRYRADVN